MAATRGDLDLGSVLGTDAAHYRDMLAGQAAQLAVEPCPGEPGASRYSPDLPDLASSCTDLALLPEICWDVCGYYRDLGVHWQASRRELRQAYHARGGPDSPRLTYVLKQLTRDGGAVRRRYDLCGLGQGFLEDEDTWQDLKRQAMRIARSHNAAGGREITEEEILAAMDIRVRRKDQEAVMEALEAPAEQATYVTGNDPWLERWGWYGTNLWQVPAHAGKYLGEWQRLLAGELAARGIRTCFAVGLDPDLPAGRTRIWWNGPNGSAIFLTGTEQPTPESASMATDGYAAHDKER